MSRNLKKEYIKKLLEIKAPAGYRFDVGNYLYNPAFGCEKPAFYKIIAEAADVQTVRRVYYMPYYGGGGTYCAETFDRAKSGDAWQVVRNVRTVELEKAQRYNLNKLLTFCTDAEPVRAAEV